MKCFATTKIVGKVGTIISAKATNEKLAFTQGWLPSRNPKPDNPHTQSMAPMTL